MKRISFLHFSMFILSFGMALAVPPPCSDADGDGVCDFDDNCPNDYNPGQEDLNGDGVGVACSECESDAECDDGLFCTANDTCSFGGCAAVSACPPFINGCIQGSYCDEKNDQCVDILDDNNCAEGEFCAPSGDCLDLGQDVGSQFCGHVQSDAQDAVDDGGPYRNHGQMTQTAANVVNPYSEFGQISEECSSCIMNQFARRVPIEEQEPCGGLCPVDFIALFPALQDIEVAGLLCAGDSTTLNAWDSSINGAGVALYNSDVICDYLSGPAICYVTISGGTIGDPTEVALTPEELIACEEVLHNYGLELEAAEKLPPGSIATCPPIDLNGN